MWVGLSVGVESVIDGLVMKADGCGWMDGVEVQPQKSVENKEEQRQLRFPESPPARAQINKVALAAFGGSGLARLDPCRLIQLYQLIGWLNQETSTKNWSKDHSTARAFLLL